MDVSLQYFMADATFEQDENALWTEQGNSLTGNNLQVSNGYLVGGDITNTAFNGSARYNERESENHDAALHVAWQPADQWHFDVDCNARSPTRTPLDLTLGSPTSRTERSRHVGGRPAAQRQRRAQYRGSRPTA